MDGRYWIWLQSVLGYGSRRLREILRVFGSAENVYRMRESDQIKKFALSEYAAGNLTGISLESAEKTLKLCETNGISVIPFASAGYPPPLKELENPPAVLYAVGSPPTGDGAGNVTVVGTRHADGYGLRAGFSLAYRLCKAGCVIVSGIAEGIDEAALSGSLAAGGRCVAILPYGHSRTGNGHNRGLFENILNSDGCLLSEIAPGAVLRRNAFVLRNRLLAALSSATAIVEAPEKSGALITADFAAQYGKEVFAVTGRPDDPLFAGSHALIRDGASPVFDARDILAALPKTFTPDIKSAFAAGQNIGALFRKAYGMKKGPPVPSKTSENHTESATARARRTDRPKPAKTDTFTTEKTTDLPKDLSQNAKSVYGLFSPGGEYLDTLLEKTGLSVGKALSALTELEIYGLVTSAPGGKYTPRVPNK